MGGACQMAWPPWARKGKITPTRRQPGRGGSQGPPVRFEVVNAGSIADAAQLLIEAVPAGYFCAGCEAIVTAADGCCKCAIWSPISRELRQGKELPLLSAAVAVGCRCCRLPLLSLQLA